MSVHVHYGGNFIPNIFESQPAESTYVEPKRNSTFPNTQKTFQGLFNSFLSNHEILSWLLISLKIISKTLS